MGENEIQHFLFKKIGNFWLNWMGDDILIFKIELFKYSNIKFVSPKKK